MNKHTDKDLPVVCTLSAAELGLRSEELLPGLIQIAQEVRELADGYAYRFSCEQEVIHRILATIQAERTCCQFLTFSLTFEPALGPAWLKVTGPEGTVDLLKSLMTAAEPIADG